MSYKMEKLSEQNGEEADIRSPSPLLNRCHLIITVFLAVLLVLAVAGLVVFAVLYGTSSSDDSNDSVCQTDACFDVSVQIKGAMDESVDPCKDFYNFTCGNWDIYNGIRPGMAGYNAIILQQDLVYRKLADVLETDFAGDNRVLMELQDFYDACIFDLFSDNVDLRPVRKIFERLGGWSVINVPGDGTEWGLNSEQFIREKMFSSEAFYSLTVDVKDAFSEYYLEIEKSGLTLESPYRYNNSFTRAIVEEHIVTTLTELSGMNTTDEIVQAAADIIEFETRLSKIWDDYNYERKNFTVAELSQLWPDHDWLTVLRGVFNPYDVDIQPSSQVTVINPDYFRSLSTLIRNSRVSVLKNYAKWHIVPLLQMALAADDIIRESIINFREGALGKPSLEKRQECVSDTESAMPIALGRVYAEHILPSGSKEAGMELEKRVREGLRQRMMEVDWLDDETRRLSIEKLDAIESRIAYPERTFDDDYLVELYGGFDYNETSLIENALVFLNFSVKQQYSRLYKPVDRNVWFSNPTKVNAYYSPYFNQITILEGIMNVPIFNKDLPLAMQYGGLGVVVGHEFTHGFDNNGRQYDKDGRERMWWTEKAVETFNNRAQCFVDQYSNYEMFGISINGNLTLGENIADNGGLRASYNAFKKVSHSSQHLPGLSDFTDDQLFFIAFGQVWCSYIDEYAFEYLTYVVHSPPPFRVLGSLMNSEDFAKAFSCPADSPMNPQNKCELW